MFTKQVDDGEIKKVKAKLIETREAVFKVNENEVSKRWSFEEAVSCEMSVVFSSVKTAV